MSAIVTVSADNTLPVYHAPSLRICAAVALGVLYALEAGTTMLIRLGRERLFVEDIARAAHVSIGALYRHFPSRELLLEALTGYLLQHGRDNSASNVLSLSSESCTTLAERVQRIVDMTIASARFALEVAKAVVTSRYDFRDGEDDETVLFTRRHLDLFTGWLLGCRDEIIHPSP